MKKRFINTPVLSAMAVTAGIALGAPMYAQDSTWTNGGGDNDYQNVANWDLGALPSGDTFAIIDLAGDAKAVNGASTENIAGLRLGNEGTGTLDHTAGDLLLDSHSSRYTSLGQTATGVGILNMSGGTARINALYLGLDGAGTFNLSGGDVSISRAHGNASIKIGHRGTGIFEISGGSLRTRNVIGLGTSGGTGTFSVVGSAATEISIGSINSVDGGWTQAAGSTLKVAVDDGGLTSIFIDDVDDDGANTQGNAEFSDGALLDVGFADGATPVDGTWVVMEVEGTFTDNGLVLAQEDIDAGWSFAFTDVGVNGTTQGEGVDTLSVTFEDTTPPALETNAVWTNAGGDNDYRNADNWDVGIVPWGPFIASINSTGDDKAVHSAGTGFNLARLYVGETADGELDITGGELIVDEEPAFYSFVGKNAGVEGVVNMSGGTVQLTTLYLGTDGHGVYNQTGGDLILSKSHSGAVRSLIVGHRGTGDFAISGGSLVTRSGVALGTSGSGVFRVIGSGATGINIGSEGDMDGFWDQSDDSVLGVQVDAGGLSKIFVDDVDDDGANAQGNVIFAAGATLDVGFADGVDPVDGTWVVMEWEGSLTDGGLVLDSAAAAEGWSLSFSDVGVNGTAQGEGMDTLSVTFVSAPDFDGDGIPDVNDPDDDNDGVDDGDDAFPMDAAESADTDGDGTGNNADTDDDNDGVDDGDDAFPLDATETIDTDGDGVGNIADSDDDGDGVADSDDAFPLDSTETVDSDGDGTGDNADTDDDNDGTLDVDEHSPKLINISTRAYVEDGDKVMIAGFVIEGTDPVTVLVQGVGSELDDDPFFVEDNMLDTVIGIYDVDGALIVENDDWDADSDEAVVNAAANGETGAFVLTVDSKSSAIVTTLEAGAYTVILSGKDGVGGVALIEAYDVSSTEE